MTAEYKKAGDIEAFLSKVGEWCAEITGVGVKIAVGPVVVPDSGVVVNHNNSKVLDTDSQHPSQ
jgi:hypothetical protein